ncbi:hypothetical protein Skr01_33690 [Sphaerisporangium krabiense]|uniref:Uncharacterized protein n=1 Tax=Sphaerisporangium krabiense TaxID=763782 RepID=A0A7W8Z2T5_9ACTN|nr:hypothetical protein [Sphaerisporangium krabiense]MBB5626366.1 hypothetical protein [Sphaerisporangium krabiense]GII63284.1 hypothetical protein Skr01_33690 [Sphaerisporangium krabiense]
MTLTATEGSAGHGPHVPKPNDDAERVTWQSATAAEDRRRVLRWTCECKPVIYYLVTAGGRGYIERTTAGGERVQTPRMRYVQIADLWEKILLGKAV